MNQHFPLGKRKENQEASECFLSPRPPGRGMGQCLLHVHREQGAAMECSRVSPHCMASRRLLAEPSSFQLREPHVQPRPRGLNRGDGSPGSRTRPKRRSAP